jgi:hypothetical protein
MFRLLFHAASTAFELADAVEKFEAGNGDFGSSEILEAEHGADLGFDRTVVLFDDIVQVL